LWAKERERGKVDRDPHQAHGSKGAVFFLEKKLWTLRDKTMEEERDD